jgi:hypothetical protein
MVGLRRKTSLRWAQMYILLSSLLRTYHPYPGILSVHRFKLPLPVPTPSRTNHLRVTPVKRGGPPGGLSAGITE